MIDGCFVVKERTKLPNLTPYRFQIQAYYEGIMKGYKPVNAWALSLVQQHYNDLITDCNLEALREVKVS